MIVYTDVNENIYKKQIGKDLVDEDGLDMTEVVGNYTTAIEYFGVVHMTHLQIVIFMKSLKQVPSPLLPKLYPINILFPKTSSMNNLRL